MADSRTEYDRRMHRVVEHIDRHLDEPLDLDRLATVANFSPFHFHRLFTAWMGETVGEYLRRRRLEVAALRLATQPDLSVLRVALSVGFGSAEAFARAFKSWFGVTPTTYRRGERRRRGAPSKRDQAMRKMDQVVGNADQATADANDDRASSRAHTLEAPMQVTLIDRQPARVAYLRYVGPYGQPVSDFWQETVYPWMVTNNLLGYPRYGVAHDDPAITAPEQCRYDACVDVPAGFAGSGRYHETVIPGGRYATTRFSGTTETIVAAWEALFRDWLPESGMQLDSRPFFEYYPLDAGYDPKTGVFECDLCIPVSPL